MNRLILSIILLLSISISFGQNTIGLPEINNYTKNQYLAGTQNWGIQQDAAGRMYFANNEGLLTFDGNYWRKYHLPSKTKVRSLAIASDGKVYVGGENEIGYFSPSENGVLAYHSLKELLPEKDQTFYDVWNVCVWKESVFFRSSSRIFEYKANKVSVYRPSSHWRFLGKSSDKLIAQDFDKGLLYFENGQWIPFSTNLQLLGKQLVTAILPVSQHLSVISTLENGLYWLNTQSIQPFATPFITEISKYRIYHAVQINATQIALSTSLNGCYIIDIHGNFIQHFSKTESLNNNNILSSFLDKQKNLWLGLDNGIAFVATNNAIKSISIMQDADAGGYASALYQGNLYLGTANGLYVAPIKEQGDLSYEKSAFRKIANSTGQVWNLQVINRQLLMGHHEGAFIVNEKSAQKIDDNGGYWTFVPLSSLEPTARLVAGNYNGLKFWNYKNGQFSVDKKVDNFHISSRFVCIDPNNDKVIWTSHPYKGVFRVSMKDSLRTEVKLYGAREGLTLSENNSFVYRLKNRVVIASENGIFEYNIHTDKFVPCSLLMPYFKGMKMYYLKEDQDGNVWFIADNRIGVLNFSNHKPQVIYFPELNNRLVSGFEFINPMNLENVIVGGEKGFFHINYKAYRQKLSKVNVLISEISATGKIDSVFYGGIKNVERLKSTEISSDFDRLTFEYSSTLYHQLQTIEYACQLEGFDATWSSWTKKTSKEYTQLPAGTYLFKVKARNNLGQESEIASYQIIILPPWYLTIWAYGFYFLLLLIAFWRLFRWQQQKFIDQQVTFQKEQKQLMYMHQLELDKNEKEIVSLKNEKLEAEIIHKNAELASSAMYLVQKAELLTKLKQDLGKMYKSGNIDEVKEDLKRMMRTVDDENTVETDWNQFSMHFDSVHSNFLMVIKERFPNLSPSELKLCAYLRMNLSTKEIAQLMNISARSVEVSRYRLRKKLQLPSEVNFFSYFLSIYEE
ncbi:triple tyrosine motif-containing protein [Flectobacillus sp. DC10W]|uniref:Triple tyrosine motif-containing protein n=1 Tax=Flectobacillus longus TaxID=2984207 RepID=A0ABT6YL18_9BACT|nr:triple tyrosine motif-containing protein [Flectobacillus longus]MDI9864292.1 triple tyrosine motif-containing protein [Flectobacillus longus]